LNSFNAEQAKLWHNLLLWVGNKFGMPSVFIDRATSIGIVRKINQKTHKQLKTIAGPPEARMREHSSVLVPVEKTSSSRPAFLEAFAEKGSKEKRS
jgi:hypothetical protein